MRQRFALIDRQLVGLQADIGLYSDRATSQVRTPPAPQPAPEPVAPAPARPQPAAAPPAQVRWTPPPRKPSWASRQVAAMTAAVKRNRGELNLSDFLGLRALAWIGGI